MTTYLIIAKNKTVLETQVTTLINQQNIHALDIVTIETQGSIGIEDIRNLQKHISLKPFRGENKAVIIKQAQLLTVEAQNALLKTLEEPPAHTYIFLTADTSESFLPTVLSRTTIIAPGEKQTFGENELEEISNQLDKVLSPSIGNKLKLAETLASDKATTLIWLEKAIHVLRNQMLQELTTAYAYAQLIPSLQEAHATIKTTNVNVRFALENLFLNL